jgi:hypothetical protein
MWVIVVPSMEGLGDEVLEKPLNEILDAYTEEIAYDYA